MLIFGSPKHLIWMRLSVFWFQNNVNRHMGGSAVRPPRALSQWSAGASSHDLYLLGSKLLMSFPRESSFFSVNIIKVLRLPFLPLLFSLCLPLTFHFLANSLATREVCCWFTHWPNKSTRHGGVCSPFACLVFTSEALLCEAALHAPVLLAGRQ